MLPVFGAVLIRPMALSHLASIKAFVCLLSVVCHPILSKSGHFSMEVEADLFNFGLTVYSTNAKAGLAPLAL